MDHLKLFFLFPTESKEPNFNKKEAISRYGINYYTLQNTLDRQEEILKMIESGKGHKTNKNRVVLSLHEKARLIEESMNPGFNAKEAGVRYGININTVVNIVKKKDQILGMVLIENERMAMEIQSNNEIGKSNYRIRAYRAPLLIRTP